jgi:hypothetical protein
MEKFMTGRKKLGRPRKRWITDAEEDLWKMYKMRFESEDRIGEGLFGRPRSLLDCMGRPTN